MPSVIEMFKVSRDLRKQIQRHVTEITKLRRVVGKDENVAVGITSRVIRQLFPIEGESLKESW